MDNKIKINKNSGDKRIQKYFLGMMDTEAWRNIYTDFTVR